MASSSPFQAFRTFLSSDTWKKSPSWWNGWRWTVARDALSYGVFFAAFDMTRRIGLRVKAFFSGDIQLDWNNFIFLDPPPSSTPSDISGGLITSPPSSQTEPPTKARVAQAITIVTGGVTASVLAEIAGRPFRTCQKLMTGNLDRGVAPGGQLVQRPNPVFETLRTQGLRPFFVRGDMPVLKPAGPPLPLGGRMKRIGTRFMWRMAAVGPWGFGFLVWAWVGGEV